MCQPAGLPLTLVLRWVADDRGMDRRCPARCPRGRTLLQPFPLEVTRAIVERGIAEHIADQPLSV